MRRTDARARYTTRVLKESLLKLLADKPVNKITVVEVCQEAGINRTTFYSHFSDCFDLLSSIEDDLLREFEASLTSADPLDVTALITSIYDMIDRNEMACRQLIFGKFNAALISRMIELARLRCIDSWQRRLTKASQSELDMLFTQLSFGLLHVVIDFYDKYDRETIIRFVDNSVMVNFAAYR